MPEMNLATTDKNIASEISTLIQRSLSVTSDSVREAALETFQRFGLPHPKHEEYKYTPLARELQNKFTFQQPAATSSLKDVSDYLIPGVDANLLVFINGIFSSSHSRIISPASELSVQSLEQALASKDATALEHFNQHTDIRSNAFAAWNTAAWTAGVFIRIPDRAAVTKPVIIHYINDASAAEVIAVNRNLIALGKGSQLTLVEKFDSAGAGNHFTSLVSEITVAENASLDLYSIRNDKGNRYQFAQTDVLQKNSSRVNTYTFDLEGRLLRTNLHLHLDGEGIESHMYGLYLLSGNTLADNHTVVDHRKAHSFSNELYKGVMDEGSRGVFNGKIFVRPQAQKTNAFQANRNILLSDKATVNTKPQLEIWADDVKCSHGCTTGQLDEEAMFYLRARGISKEAARAMLLYAFSGEVVDKIGHEGIKSYIDRAIGERFQKNF